jgi:hypothetical protein
VLIIYLQETDNQKVPVKLEYLFPDYEEEKQDGDKTTYNLQVNSGKGGASEADDNAFGFVIMSGMPSIIRAQGLALTTI